jgi:hypothetical protein
MVGLWCTLRGYERDVQRAVIQNFNLSMLAVTLTIYVASGIVTRSMLPMILVVLPKDAAAEADGSVGETAADGDARPILRQEHRGAPEHEDGAEDRLELAVTGALTGQIIAAVTMRRGFDLRLLAPFVLGGLAGVPLGTLLLPTWRRGRTRSPTALGRSRRWPRRRRR